MDLYEHQGKALFAEHGIPLVEGFLAETAEEARRIAERLGGPRGWSVGSNRRRLAAGGQAGAQAGNLTPG